MPLSIHGTNGITFNDGSTQTTRPAVGFRNRIINGDMMIDQRNSGASQSITAASPSYSVDRWIVRPIGGTVTGQRVAGSGADQFRYQITGGASVTQLQFEQRIESLNSYDLAGGNATLSLKLSNSLLTTVSWILYYANSSDNFSANTLISSGNWTVSSTIANYSATISIPAAATTGLYLILYVGAQTSGTWTIGNVQLEAGSTATDFERRPYGTELALCQRYFYQTSDNLIYLVVGPAGAQRWAQFNTPHELRANPTVVIYGNTNKANAGQFQRDDNTFQNITAANAGKNNVSTYLNATGSTNNFYFYSYSLSSEL